MNNFSQEPGRRVVTDAAGLNSFLTRMYGNMTMAVLVSAFSAYLTWGYSGVRFSVSLVLTLEWFGLSYCYRLLYQWG